ncbi:4-(cytidine 5'-diphospho)-2-C-methyl-D-erythritol kinase [PVC group bacterium (ex Bugula neritina AB1)]|nr:4-(cytidine 5'-diphospho)-2-C-methyl-D-erythritol kinase [PVC group bacterium (ex Bugula neritina AB1)]
MPVAFEMLAYAKVNLFLDVLGLRDDDYCELDTVFQEIDLADRMEFSFVSNGKSCFEFFSDKYLCPEKDNLIYKAFRIFSKSFSADFSIRVYLKKEIPIGAGLGGGSSNAATTLLAMARYTGVPLEDLYGLAEQLGADVPFFLKGGRARAKGRGEKIEQLSSCRECLTERCLIVYPKLNVSTSKVFGYMKHLLTKEVGCDKKRLLFLQKNGFNPDGFCFCRSENGSSQNSLEEVALSLYPDLRQVKKDLRHLGFPFLQMSGSGSSFFSKIPALFEDSKLLDLVTHLGYDAFFSKPVFRESS